MKLKLKKLVLVCLALCLCLCGVACNGGGDVDLEPTETQFSDALARVIDADEYIEYQNMFYQQSAPNYVGQEYVKEGVFCTIYDEYYQGGKARYYVWGYYDGTLCCDWQWELDIQDTSELPANGSLVQVKGTFTQNDSALDKYWLTDVEWTVKTVYTGEQYNIGGDVMNSTLGRVQMLNLQYAPAKFEGQSIAIYGRVASPSSIQHPYYDGSWTQSVITESEMPAIGTMVLVVGTVRSGAISNATVTVTNQYG